MGRQLPTTCWCWVETENGFECNSVISWAWSWRAVMQRCNSLWCDWRSRVVSVVLSIHRFRFKSISFVVWHLIGFRLVCFLVSFPFMYRFIIAAIRQSRVSSTTLTRPPTGPLISLTNYRLFHYPLTASVGILSGSRHLLLRPQSSLVVHYSSHLILFLFLISIYIYIYI